MRAQKSGIDFVVLMGGVATSFAALVLLFLLGLFNIDPMSYYILFIIPIGALGVGLAAGSGYALASWIRSVFVQRSTKIIIFALGALTYVLAHYITYRLTLLADGISADAFSFVDYIRMLCENISYSSDVTRDEEGVALGKFGYALKLIECVGFGFGGIIPLLILQTVPYCHLCGRYKKKLVTSFIESEEKKDLLKKQKKAVKQELINTAVAKTTALAEPLLDQMETNSLEDNLALIESQPRKGDSTSLARLRLSLSKCPECNNHTIIATIEFVTLDRQPGVKELRRLDVSTS